MLALTKKMVWSASMTTLKNTTTQQCSTKLTKRCGGSDLCSLFLCFAWIVCSCNTQILHEFLKMSTCLFFPLFSDVEMYTAGWETKVYGSGNHSKPTICAEGEGGLQQHWSCFFLFWLMCVFLVEWARLKMFSCWRVCCPKSSNFKLFIEAEDKMLRGLETVWSLFVAHVACLSRLCCQVTWCLQSLFHEIHCWAFDKHWLCNSPFSV